MPPRCLWHTGSPHFVAATAVFGERVDWRETLGILLVAAGILLLVLGA